MTKKQIEDIYDTLTGVIDEPFQVPGVENLFVEGSECMNCYSEAIAAYGRLCARLGVEGEDEDIETIINSLLRIERKVGMKMFEYGVKFALEEKS